MSCRIPQAKYAGSIQHLNSSERDTVLGREFSGIHIGSALNRSPPKIPKIVRHPFKRTRTDSLISGTTHTIYSSRQPSDLVIRVNRRFTPADLHPQTFDDAYILEIMLGCCLMMMLSYRL